MVRPVTVHLKAPGDLATDHVDGHHIRVAGPGHDQQAPIRGAVHVVHILVVALTDQYPNTLKKQQIEGIQGNRFFPFLLVRNPADTTQALVAGGIDHINHPFPVIAHEDHRTWAVLSLFRYLLSHLIRRFLLLWRFALGLIDTGRGRCCRIAAPAATAGQQRRGQQGQNPQILNGKTVLPDSHGKLLDQPVVVRMLLLSG